MVDGFGVFSDDISADVANDFEHAGVVVHSVFEVEGSVVEVFGVGKVALFELNDFAHHRVVEVMQQVGIICKKVSHGSYLEFFL